MIDNSKKGVNMVWSTQGDVVHGDMNIIGASNDEIQFEVSDKGEYHYGLN